MMGYTLQQIEAVRKLASLHDIQGELNDKACANYLDWHLRTQTAAARGIESVGEAKESGYLNGAKAHSQQKLMLKLLAQ